MKTSPSSAMLLSIVGDSLVRLGELPDESVQACVTSIPYWGLRSYLDDADPMKRHEIGLEGSIAEWLEKIVAVFEQVRRVLRRDGTLWINIGDAYNAGTSAPRVPTSPEGHHGYWTHPLITHRVHVPALKRKDLIGMPWMVAFALRSAGWYLRSEIVWHKRNPQPESPKDRPCREHEQVFLLAKSSRYYYDQEATKEPASPNTHSRGPRVGGHQAGALGKAKSIVEHKRPGLNPKAARVAAGDRKGPRPRQNDHWSANHLGVVEKRNGRTVWKMSTQPYRGNHYATFPQALARRCIVASTRPGDLVLDPFAGVYTTALEAVRLGRRAVMIELNRDSAIEGVERVRRLYHHDLFSPPLTVEER